MPSQSSKEMVNICLFNCRTKYESNRLTPTPHIKLVNQLFYTRIVIARSLRRRQTDILYVGESSLDIGEQTVRETTRRRNDRLPTTECARGSVILTQTSGNVNRVYNNNNNNNNLILKRFEKSQCFYNI